MAANALPLGNVIPTFGSKHLRVSHTHIGQDEVDNICNVFAAHPDLRTFMLLSSRFTTKDSALSLCRAIRNSPIISLYFSSVPMVEDAVACLATSIQETGMRVLELASVGVTDDGAKRLADALRHSYVLHNVCLKNNMIRQEGCIALAKALPDSSVDILDLSGNVLGGSVIPKLISPGCRLTSLKLGNTFMGQQGFEDLCAAIVLHGVDLKLLDVEGNAIFDLHCICPIIERSRALMTLVLSDNRIVNLGAFNVAVARCSTLRRIDLDRNRQLTDAAVEDMLTTAIHCNSGLATVNLGSTGTSQAVKKRIKHRLDVLNAKSTKIILALCSGKHPRLGLLSAVGRTIPVDLIRLVAELI